jgi:hypothetical protein
MAHLPRYFTCRLILNTCQHLLLKGITWNVEIFNMFHINCSGYLLTLFFVVLEVAELGRKHETDKILTVI